MQTEIALDGTKFFINGIPTYEGISHYGKPVEGLLFNSRMVQAIFDDANPQTRVLWAYPDTGKWDAQRNTDEFCAQLPIYRAHGLLAVTVGLQGGGSDYTAGVYNSYRNSAFTANGVLKDDYFTRLYQVLQAADNAGMVVIVNYFYVKQVAHIPADETLYAITEQVTDWLLRTGFRNILVDVANEANDWWNRAAFSPANVHLFIDIVKQTTLDGRRLLVGVSTGGGDDLPSEPWLAAEDFSMPHGNGCSATGLRKKLQRLKAMEGYHRRPHPILINEDTIFVDNMEAAMDEYASWGFYCQGYGSNYSDRMDWKEFSRETVYDALSGFQTLPVNWGINTPDKQAFFGLLKAVTSGNNP